MKRSVKDIVSSLVMSKEDKNDLINLLSHIKTDSEDSAGVKLYETINASDYTFGHTLYNMSTKTNTEQLSTFEDVFSICINNPNVEFWDSPDQEGRFASIMEAMKTISKNSLIELQINAGNLSNIFKVPNIELSQGEFGPYYGDDFSITIPIGSGDPNTSGNIIIYYNGEYFAGSIEPNVTYKFIPYKHAVELYKTVNAADYSLPSTKNDCNTIEDVLNKCIENPNTSYAFGSSLTSFLQSLSDISSNSLIELTFNNDEDQYITNLFKIDNFSSRAAIDITIPISQHYNYNTAQDKYFIHSGTIIISQRYAYITSHETCCAVCYIPYIVPDTNPF